MKKTFSFVCESCGICRAVATFDEFGECTVKEIHNQPCEIVENEIDILTEDKKPGRYITIKRKELKL